MSRKNSPELLVLAFLVFLMMISVFLGINYKDRKAQFETAVEPLIFLGNDSLAPILFEEDDTSKGVVADITKELSKKMGMPIKVELMKWDEAQTLFLSGYGDALLRINRTEDREKVYGFSSPLLISEFALFVRYGDRRIRGLEDLTGKTVGIQAMGYISSVLEEMENVEVKAMKDLASGFLSLEKRELDAIILDRWIGAYELARSRAGGISILSSTVREETSHIAVRKENTALLEKINDGLRQMDLDGSMEKILYNWQGKKIRYVTEDHYMNLLLTGMVWVMIVLLAGAVYSVSKFRNLSVQLKEDVENRTRDLEEAKKKLEEVNGELLLQSLLDPLTGIPNRRYFGEVFHRIFEKSIAEKKPLALLILDIDNFKEFNDTHGHLAGDRCLKKAAETIRRFSEEKGGFAARYGGEEFVVILEKTAEEAQSFGLKLLNLIEKEEIEAGEKKTHITVSVGFSSLSLQFQSTEEMFHAADEALYQAKESGKNQIRCYGEVLDFIENEGGYQHG